MRYRKKPVVINAWELTWENKDELARRVPDGQVRYAKKGDHHEVFLTIPTLEGVMTAQLGDFIIKGIQGEFYPCKPDIFHATYELVEENP
jgi:hypothetical protein